MTALPWLDSRNYWFPDPESALDDPDGLLAIGGDLSPTRILHAYEQGIFPWFSDDQPILWWSPNPRCVLFPEDVHVSRSLRRKLNRGAYSVTINQAFPEVIRLCGDLREEGTWITPDMEIAYCNLHDLGYAHSFEAWDNDGTLVGGLYGVALGRCFFGESMFSRQPDASKVIMVHVGGNLREWGYRVMDCQVENPHLLRMGASLIPRSQFLTIIRKNVHEQPLQDQWRPTWQWRRETSP